MAIIDATRAALDDLQRRMRCGHWDPSAVRIHRVRNCPSRDGQGTHELVLIDPRTGKVRDRSPKVLFTPTVSDTTRVRELEQDELRGWDS